MALIHNEDLTKHFKILKETYNLERRLLRRDPDALLARVPASP